MRRRLFIIVALMFGTFLAVIFVPSRSAQTVKVSLNVIYDQEGAPVEIISVTSDTQYYFTKAEVKNVSDRRIQSVTFGVLLHEVGSRQNGILISKREVPTDILPGASRSMDTFGAQTKIAREQAMKFKSSPVAADFGVLQVQFEDGGSWRSPAEDNKSFPPQEASVGASRKQVGSFACSRTPLSAFISRVMPSVFAQGGYYCVASSIHEICTVNASGISCTVTRCNKLQIQNGQCSNQACAYN
jgi:hypothetical protein